MHELGKKTIAIFTLVSYNKYKIGCLLYDVIYFNYSYSNFFTIYKGLIFMKNKKSLLVCSLMSLSLAFSNVLMTVNANEVQNVSVVENTVQDIIGYDKSGNAVYGGVYDVIAGFSEDGTPIIETSPYNKITGVPASRASIKYDNLGFKVIFGSYEEFEGFDENGNPILSYNKGLSDGTKALPLLAVIMAYDKDGETLLGGVCDRTMGVDAEGDPVIWNYIFGSEHLSKSVLGVDDDGNKIYGGVYDVLLGFNEDGTPDIVTSPYNKITGVPENPVILGYDDAGYVILGTEDEKLVGFDEKGNPVVLNVSDDIQIAPIETVGDINGDSKTELTDLTELSLHLIGDKKLSDDELLRADVNNDEKVDLADLAALKMEIVNP